MERERDELADVLRSLAIRHRNADGSKRTADEMWAELKERGVMAERGADSRLGEAIIALRSQGTDYLQIGLGDIIDIRSDRARELQRQMRATITDAAEKAPR